MAASVRSHPVPKFAQGETVLCYEPDLTKSRVLYEAKVLEVDVTKDDKGKKVPEYFIHFNGWNKSWDRWVVEDQVLKNSDANKTLKSKLHEQACKFHKKRKQQRNSTSSQDNSENTDTVAKPDVEAENGDQPKVEIEIPSQLKFKLEDDCYFIKRKKKLVLLPRTPCVEDILEEYYQYYLKTHSECRAHLVKELMDGLKIYFNFTLPTLLLYNFEREQFRNIMQYGPGESAFPENLPTSDPSMIEEKCGIVSSTTENAISMVNEPTDSPKEKEKRTLRRRALRSNVVQNDQQTSPSIPTSPTSQTGSEISNQSDKIDQPNQSTALNNEESQSSTVSSTSSPTDNSISRLSLKRKAKDIEEPETINKQPSPGLCSSLPLTSALLSNSCKVLPSKVYGPEHLLRLFVKLPGLLGKTEMPEVNLTTLLDHIDLFLKYLVERSSALFQEDVYYSFL